MPLDPEPGRLLVRTICARGVREVQKTHGKLQRCEGRNGGGVGYHITCHMQLGCRAWQPPCYPDPPAHTPAGL